MGQNRVQVDGGANNVRAQQAGDIVMSQLRMVNNTTVGAATFTVNGVLNGIINRSGPVAGYIDTLPSAAQLIAASGMSAGDSFNLIVRNTVAFAQTLAAGTGIVLGVLTGSAASSVRQYLLTVLAIGTEQILQVSSINASNLLLGLTPAQAVIIQPGQGVTGVGIPALTTVVGINSNTGVITMSAAATATGTVAGTFFPRISIEGVLSASL